MASCQGLISWAASSSKYPTPEALVSKLDNYIGSIGRSYQIPNILLRNPTLPLPFLTDSHALSFTCPPFAFGPISSPDLLGIPEGRPQRWVGSLQL